MTRIQVGILTAIAILCVAAVVGLVRQSKENQLLEQQVAVAQLTADNQRLSNLLDQAKAVQVASRAQQEELLKLKSDFNRFRLERESANHFLQAQVAEQLTNQVHDFNHAPDRGRYSRGRRQQPPRSAHGYLLGRDGHGAAGLCRHLHHPQQQQ